MMIKNTVIDKIFKERQEIILHNRKEQHIIVCSKDLIEREIKRQDLFEIQVINILITYNQCK